MQTIPLSQAVKEITDYEAAVSTQVVDLRELDYVKDTEQGSVMFQGQRFELTLYSAQALCKACHLPFGYFRKASEQLVKPSFREFALGLSEKSHDVQFVKYEVQGADPVLRGVLPMNQQPLSYASMLNAFLPLESDGWEVESAKWREFNHMAIMRTRLVNPKAMVKVGGDDVCMGIDIMGSDVCAAPTALNLMLFRQVCTNGAIASYGERPYFNVDPKTSSVFDMPLLVDLVAKRIRDDASQYLDMVKAAQDTPMTMAGATSLLKECESRRALPHGPAVRVLRYLEENKPACLWDFVNAITAVARSYGDQQRIALERVGGAMLGLKFTRSQDEEKLPAEAKDLPSLPPVKN